MKTIIKTSLILFIILTLTDFGIETISNKGEVKAAEKSVLADLPPVLHGLGWIEGHFVTNSLEAFQYNYNRGFRVFEVDLNMTSDNVLVARHDWTRIHYRWLGQDVPPGTTSGVPLTLDKVMSLKIHGKYHPISCKQLLDLMRNYPDIYFVTDTKETDERSIRKTFSYLVNETKKWTLYYLIVLFRKFIIRQCLRILTPIIILIILFIPYIYIRTTFRTQVNLRNSV